MKMNPFPADQVSLLPSLFAKAFERNQNYINQLKNGALVQNFEYEAGIGGPSLRSRTHESGVNLGDDMHWGWETPTCQLRGHFTGHWLSAAARLYQCTGDMETKARVNKMIDSLERCQHRNGGEWLGSIPEEFLSLIAQGEQIWAPHYTLHKTLMGLYDAYEFAGSEKALELLKNYADWFITWTSQFSREEMDDILDYETGGMMEAWANLYGATGEQKHLELMQTYERSRLFNALVAGEDVLTNYHANTTIPEAHGMARAYEVTGDERYRQATEAYWKCAVTDRGTFCTGSQSSGEVWTPPNEFAARLGNKTQEYCVVYNMIRLADYLYRWSGDVEYADYIERNMYNGLLAGQNKQTGMVAYFMRLEAGSYKFWGTPTHDFWCCHGTLVQSHTRHNENVYYESEGNLSICQYVPSELRWGRDGGAVTVRQEFDDQSSGTHSHVQNQKVIAKQPAIRKPKHWKVKVTVSCETESAFALQLRLPSWMAGDATILLNGEPLPAGTEPGSFYTIDRTWSQDEISLVFPKEITCVPIPDTPEFVAFVDGPVVLAGICDGERTLYGDPTDAATMLETCNEREWSSWQANYKTVNQECGIKFVPTYDITDERYSVYFPTKPVS